MTSTIRPGEETQSLPEQAKERVQDTALSECTFIDSTGLGILVKADSHIGRNALLIVATGPAVLRTFEVSGLDRQFALRPSLESALNGGAASGWREKEARSQALFREVNERIEQIAENFGATGQSQLICECGNPSAHSRSS
jgi:hypothetical protein